MADWWSFFSAALTGGATVKLLDIGYQELRRRSEHSRGAREIVDRHLDPVLKTADEVVGKLRSMAERDFKSLRRLDGASVAEFGRSEDAINLSYLLARFWARIEILRRESLYVALTEDPRGKRLLQFLDCLESQRVRMVTRARQRAIGELMLEGSSTLECISSVRFAASYRSDTDFQTWLNPLMSVLSRTRHVLERQRILQYGVVLHAMIDTLDPSHQVTRSRPGYPNKLTERSKRGLRYRVFGRYLSFVDQPTRYLVQK